MHLTYDVWLETLAADHEYCVRYCTNTTSKHDFCLRGVTTSISGLMTKLCVCIQANSEIASV